MGYKSVKNMSRKQQKAVFAKMGDAPRTSFKAESNREKIMEKEFPKEAGLNYSAAIFVPSTRKDKPITEKEFTKRIKETKSFLNTNFKGSTTVRSVGSFTDEKGSLINENVAIVTAHTNKKGYSIGSKNIKSFLEDKKKAWTQESMGFAFESPEKPSKSFYFVKPKKKIKKSF